MFIFLSFLLSCILLPTSALNRRYFQHVGDNPPTEQQGFQKQQEQIILPDPFMPIIDTSAITAAEERMRQQRLTKGNQHMQPIELNESIQSTESTQSTQQQTQSTTQTSQSTESITVPEAEELELIAQEFNQHLQQEQEISGVDEGKCSEDDKGKIKQGELVCFS